MADLSYLKKLDKPVAILGLGVSGAAVANACRDSNVDCHLWDDHEEKRQGFIDDGFDVIDFENDLSRYAAVIPAAGIKPNHPTIQKAIDQKIPFKSDIDLLYGSAPKATYIGITGTNGKSTTTALLSHILKSVGKNHAMGGNIGIGATSLPSFDADGVYVLEMSSYQLEITQQPIFDISVLLNITPDHLAWHGTMENYAAAKEKIFRTKGQKQTAIIGIDDDISRTIAEKLKNSANHDVVEISSSDTLPDGLDQIETLKGAHNQQNIAAAYAVCKKLGITDHDFVTAVQSFPGLIHRQQIVATINGITFINDSKATNAESTSKALDSFDNIHWIAGGEHKGDDLSVLKEWYPKVKRAYLIGEAAPLFEKDMIDTLKYSNCETLEKAVFEAFENASDGDIILMSMACASFDQYPNFEKRGEHFIALIEQLKQRQAS